jgi:hypothetical protein
MGIPGWSAVAPRAAGTIDPLVLSACCSGLLAAALVHFRGTHRIIRAQSVHRDLPQFKPW